MRNPRLSELVEESEDQAPGRIGRCPAKFGAEVADLELESLLSGEYDSSNAILSIHPGAGGTESQDCLHAVEDVYPLGGRTGLHSRDSGLSTWR